jgi:hypothetical protein
MWNSVDIEEVRQVSSKRPTRRTAPLEAPMPATRAVTK